MRRCLIAALLLIATACGRAEEARPLTEEEVAAELAELDLEPGRWETSTLILSADGPLPRSVLDRIEGRRTGAASCITAEQAERPSATFLAAQQGSDCTYRDFAVEDGRLSATMTCSGGRLPAAMETRLSGTYAARAYDLDVEMATGGPGGAAMTIRARSTGRRVGDC